ncbi:alkaline phosphatase [Pareuzebyella sediminis]|uniref:alkaline phosphatase n=1 Tax=Pareuzebyella sediminis TaxID=2607998 RepID=UPI001E35C80B|nr:alkaline phosphatase [Pareuzebyella sediminis]
MKKLTLYVCLLFAIKMAFPQEDPSFRVHSHNDYLQDIPFYAAVAAGASSVEADVFLKDDKLMVAHTKAEIVNGRTLESLYLEPLQRNIEMDFVFERPFQLLIDIKSEAYPTLEAITEVLKKYPAIISKKYINIVISGNRPKIEDYTNYPDYIFFDYQSLDPVTDSKTRNKIALVSLSFKNFSTWNGKGRLTAEDYNKVSSVIEKAHAIGKPFRFWATPDSKTSWKAFVKLGVDFINTDMPFECVSYTKTLHDREYGNKVFSKVYRPTFSASEQNQKVKNIILMIGDGNGLTQISAAALANKGELTLTQLKDIGFLKTQSADDFTTDSAGAGTAISTGKKTRNRAIGVDVNGKPIENITELLSKKGFVSGIVTTDEISGATPSAFFAHQKDRSQTEDILNDLSKSDLSLFISNGQAKEQSNFAGFSLLPNLKEIGNSKENKVGFFIANTTAKESNSGVLANATQEALQFLSQKNRPFFLMVEGAKIDSYGHENEIDGVISEGISFDKAVSKVIEFADKNPQTLVIITADHETGGLTIPQGNLENNTIEGDFTTHDHTGTMVPIFAYGPQSNTFQGVYENNEVFHKISKVLGVK